MKTAIFFSMAPGDMKKELFKNFLFAEEDMTYEEAEGWARRMIDEGDLQRSFQVSGKFGREPSGRICGARRRMD